VCGICGIFDSERRLAAIAEMNQLQRHRGPDDEGYLFVNTATLRCCAAIGVDTAHVSGGIRHEHVPASEFDLALGSRRLAVLDLSPAGHMPMTFEGGAFWITYNGEIYNYRELRTVLQELGYRFATETDTEVILAAYSAWGSECVRRFNGMFAFALWDPSRRRLFCARDHFGIKPFYYYWDGSTLIFASEIKALFGHPAVPRRPDEQSIFDFLTTCQSDHEPRTFFDKIVPLPAGSLLTLDVRSRELTTRRWWQAAINTELGGRSEQADRRICAEFGNMLEDAVRLRLRSDVPIGTCLSGGLDSSSIACLTNKLLQEKTIARHVIGEQQKTFTARNQDQEIDEYAYSRLVVEQTRAAEHLIYSDGARLWTELQTLAWHLDEPVGSTSVYQQWNVMRLAREHGVTVLLDGQGADELLAGYYPYLSLHIQQTSRERGFASALRAAWASWRIGGAPVLNTLYTDLSLRLPWRVRTVLGRLITARSAGTAGAGLSSAHLDAQFLRDHAARALNGGSSANLAAVLYRDLTATGLPRLLRYEDRTSMAFSLEARLPFLDHRLVEFAVSLPMDYRIRDGWTKWILRRAMSGILPEAICWRRTKLAFPTPERRWLTDGAPHVRRLLRDNRDALIAYVQPGFLAQAERRIDADLSAIPGIWRLCSLAVWLQLFCSGARVANAPAEAHFSLA
jgi:asparagine synthase (glutamine-hydrolysing)